MDSSCLERGGTLVVAVHRNAPKHWHRRRRDGWINADTMLEKTFAMG